jgi:hypothetical protein
MTELVYGQKTNNRNALLQRILDAAKGIRNNPHILEDITTLISHAQMHIQITGRHFAQCYNMFSISNTSQIEVSVKFHLVQFHTKVIVKYIITIPCFWYGFILL